MILITVPLPRDREAAFIEAIAAALGDNAQEASLSYYRDGYFVMSLARYEAIPPELKAVIEEFSPPGTTTVEVDLRSKPGVKPPDKILLIEGNAPLHFTLPNAKQSGINPSGKLPDNIAGNQSICTKRPDDVL